MTETEGGKVRWFLSVLAIFFSQIGTAHAACDGPAITRSATVARDIGGVALGSDIRDVAKRFAVSHVSGEWYEFTNDGTHFEVGVSPLGRIYNIAATQKLGRFAPDRQFVQTLTEKLTAKFGRPVTNQLPDGPAQWGIVEGMRQSDGTVLNRETNWASLILSTSDDEVTSQMKIVDFRVLWQDQVKLNCSPSQKAAEKLSF